MARNYIKEFINALENNNGFNYLCEVGWDIRKDDILKLLKELTYAVETVDLLPSELTEIVDEMKDNLRNEIEDVIE